MPTERQTSVRLRPYRFPLGWVVALACAAALAAGCEHEAPPDTFRQVIEIAELPENVRKAAQKALPDVKLMDAWRNVNTAGKTLHSYEIRGRNARGKIREVRIAVDGKVLEME